MSRAEAGGTLSATGLCRVCGHERFISNIVHLTTHRGDYFEHWRRRMAASVGAIIPESKETIH